MRSDLPIGVVDQRDPRRAEEDRDGQQDDHPPYGLLAGAVVTIRRTATVGVVERHQGDDDGRDHEKGAQSGQNPSREMRNPELWSNAHEGRSRDSSQPRRNDLTYEEK